MGAFLSATKRKRKWLTGPLCLMGPIRWWCRRIFCPRAKPPPLVKVPTPTPALHPSVIRSAVPRPLRLTKGLMLLPPVQPDLLHHTRRRRTPALHVLPQGLKPADLLWMRNSLPSYSSSNGITLEDLEPSVGKTLRWASSTCIRKVSLILLCSSRSTRTPKPQGNMASSDQVMALVLFLHQGAN